MLQKFAGPLMGPIFCGGPCSAKHVEHALPKFASEQEGERKVSCYVVQSWAFEAA